MDKIIQIRNYEFSYPDKKSVLTDINVHVYEKETVGLVGANGAGKSTILLSVVGILEGKGDIVVSGLKPGGKNLKELREKIGFIFQNPDDQLFSTTVFDDVAFGPLNMDLSGDEVRRRVKKALGEVEMAGFEERLPHHLSIGEKKRIAIAAVLSMEPEILIIDEPSCSLDSGVRRKLMDLLGKFDTTAFIASHDLDLIANLCGRVYVLKSGRIIGEGKPGRVLTDEKLMLSAGLEPLKGD